MEPLAQAMPAIPLIRHCLQDLVLSHAVRKANTVRAAAIQVRDFSQNQVQTSLSPWLLESHCHAQLWLQERGSAGQLHPQTSVTPA